MMFKKTIIALAVENLEHRKILNQTTDRWKFYRRSFIKENEAAIRLLRAAEKIRRSDLGGLNRLILNRRVKSLIQAALGEDPETDKNFIKE